MRIVTITGPSGSGKTTLLNNLCATYPFKSIVSHTTRPMRQGEVEGTDYFFVTPEQFASMWADGLLVESVEFNGQSYGVSVGEIDKVLNEDGKIPVLIVEPNGLKQIKKYFWGSDIGVHSVFMEAKLATLISRYLPRIVADTQDYPLKIHGMLPYHSKRLASISQEFVEWREEIYSYRCKNETEKDMASTIADILFDLRHEDALKDIKGSIDGKG